MNNITYYIIMVLVGIYGLCVGSFLNVVIYRLPAGLKMGNERSMCPKCKNQIHWYDNIPLFSYIILGGKCRHCKEKISIRYPLVEASNMLLWLLSFVIYKDNLFYAAITALASSLSICIFLIDFDTKLIYDRFQIMLVCLGIASIFADNTTVWYSHIIAAVVSGFTFYGLGTLITKIKGVDALGMGDVKLAFCMGLILGLAKMLLAILLSSVSATVILLILRKKNDDESEHEYPFGPFLVSGLMLAMLFGNAIINRYLCLLGI